MINLSNYEHSSAFHESNDEAWANRIIFTFASILTHVFQPENGPSLQQWMELQADVARWNSSKPWDFAPLWIEELGSPGDQPWPEVMMSQNAQVVGMQYYCLANIILSIYDPRLSKLGFEGHRLRKLSEAIVLKNLRMVISLAVCNDDVGSAMFHASHILSTCGSYLTDPIEREGAVDFLARMQRQMGWHTSHIISNLREQWQL
ncbi:hypothetical protein W97_00329 [Coniosporium apollinis CBS 100218]|uniref:Transcription factor domain-containing protein n=1 Tax=Coniosporium apollinis (strain CBS 100218) TaxID=1168221 RepID=R7YGX1_CONA1|nr:uncharacterized protein W97_00329 [Coniosporium apollinis CBS 100218]EON61118.1 hypothetical protein W97_00329 [Coniosporium apollinis CBS 100218]